MADFVEEKSDQNLGRWVATLSGGDTVASIKLEKESNVTIDITLGSVSHSVRGTGVEVRSITTDEAYRNHTLDNTFTFTPGTSAVITIDVVRS